MRPSRLLVDGLGAESVKMKNDIAIAIAQDVDEVHRGLAGPRAFQRARILARWGFAISAIARSANSERHFCASSFSSSRRLCWAGLSVVRDFTR
jgi:hypothetical protein